MDVNPPLVSVCIPTYNCQNTLQQTINSILNQTYKNLLIIVSDNSSTDDTIKIIKSYDDNRIKLHCSAINLGAENNFNNCINLAEGKYVAIFHADDIYENDIIEKQVSFLESTSEVGAVCTDAKLIDENNNSIKFIKFPKSLRNKNNIYNFKEIFTSILEYGNFLISPSFMIRSDILKRDIKIFNSELFSSSSDLDVWLRILLKSSIGHLPVPLINYRISKVQHSAIDRLSTNKAVLFKVLEYYLSSNLVKSFVTQKDIQNYIRLERRDRVSRAINFFILDQPNEASKLLEDIFSVDSFFASFKKKGFFTLFIGSYVKFLILFKLNSFGKYTLKNFIPG